MYRRLFCLFLLVATLSPPMRAHATVNEVVAANRYVGNGSTTSFTYGFVILANTDIEVLVDGTTKVLTTHYTVSGVGASGGGSVSFVTAPATGTVVTLLRKQAVTQQSHYVPNQPFPSTQIEKDLDKQTMINQQQAEVNLRTLRAPKAEGLDLTLPTVANRKSKFLGFDANGLPVGLSASTSTPGTAETIINVVTDQGADPTGAVDSVPAINAAITAASALPTGGRVRVPCGTYLLSTSSGTGLMTTLLVPKSNVTIVGDSVDCVEFKANSSLTAIVGNWNFMAVVGVTNFEVTGIKFNPNGNLQVTGNEPIQAFRCVTSASLTCHDIWWHRDVMVNFPGNNIVTVALSTSTDPLPYNVVIDDNGFDTFGKSVTGNTANTDHSAIYLQGKNCAVRRNRFTNPTHTNTSQAIEHHTQNCEIIDNLILGVDTGDLTAGITSDSLENIIDRNIMSGVYRGIYYWCATGQVCRNNHWTRNIIRLEPATSDGTSGSVIGGGIYPGTVTGTQIDNDVNGNQIFQTGDLATTGSGKSATGIYITNALGWKVRNNTVSRITGPGIFMYQTGTRTFSTISVQGNDITDVGVGGVANSKVGIDLLAAGATMTEVDLRGNRIANRDYATTLTGIRVSGNVSALVVHSNPMAVTTQVDTSAYTGTSSFIQKMIPDSNGGTWTFGAEVLAKVFHASSLGTASAVAYGPFAGIYTGLFFPDNNTVGWSAQGTEVARSTNALFTVKVPLQSQLGGDTLSQAPVSSHVYTDVTAPANVSTGETDLYAFVLPANAFTSSALTLEWTVSAIFAANGNTKTVRAYYGGTGVCSYAGADNNVVVDMQMRTYRTGANAQRHHCKVFVGTALGTHTITTSAITETATTIMKMSGQSGTTGGDVTGQGFDIKLNN